MCVKRPKSFHSHATQRLNKPRVGKRLFRVMRLDMQIYAIMINNINKIKDSEIPLTDI